MDAIKFRQLVTRCAEDYMGKPLVLPQMTTRLPRSYAGMAAEYAKRPVSMLDDPSVRIAYQSLCNHLVRLWGRFPVELKIQAGDGEPWARYDDMVLIYHPTTPEALGHDWVHMQPEHPLFTMSPITDRDGRLMTYDELLQVVREFYGMGLVMPGSDLVETENVWRVLDVIFQSSMARWALATEIRGWNAIRASENLTHRKAILLPVWCMKVEKE